MTEKKTTKERILEESMKLFSVYGFDSVSVRTIASKVGVRDSALYKHFNSKQEIFDAIVTKSKAKFYKKYEELEICHCSDINFVDMCMAMFKFQTEDEWIIKFRQMLIIEQFKNLEIAEIYRELFIDMPVNNQAKVFEKLMEDNVIKKNDPKVMAIELYAPFFMFHTIHKSDSYEIMLRKHAENFKDKYLI